MLILSRRVGESIRINDNTTVTITEIHGNHVKLAFTAPDSVSIVREELVVTNTDTILESKNKG